MAAPAPRAPSRARCSTCRRKPTYGFQSRYDDINLSLSNTFQRQFLSATLNDHVNEGNAGIYAENTVHWTDWMRTTLGWRGDYYSASVNSILQQANSGNTQAAIGSPKFRMVFGPFAATEFFVGAGMGYHSNDARSTTDHRGARRSGEAGRARRRYWFVRAAPRSASAPRSCRDSTVR